MARGGLNDDDDDQSIVALAKRPLSQQRNNGTAEPPAPPPDAPVVPPQPSAAAAGTTANGAPPSPPAPVEPPPEPAPVTAERRAAIGRPRKPEPRILLRATVTKPNHEWVEQMWRTQLRADGSRYANMGEFIDELVTLARVKAGR